MLRLINRVPAWVIIILVGSVSQADEDYRINFEQTEGFKSGLRISNLERWTLSDQDPVVTRTKSYSGDQSLSIPRQSHVTFMLNETGKPVCFFDLRLGLTGECSVVASSESGLDGLLAKWIRTEENSLELSVGNENGADTTRTGIRRTVDGDWERMTFRLDLEKGLCDIYLGGVLTIGDISVGSPMESPGMVAISIETSAEAGCLLDCLTVSGNNPLFPDEDRDGIADSYELLTGGSIFLDDRNGDSNENTISNLEEYIRDLHAFDRDTDRDGVADAVETRVGLDPDKQDIEGARGLVRRDTYYGARGVLEDLRRSEQVVKDNKVTDYMTSLEQPPGVGKHYRTRVRGFLTAPSTGDYQFWVSGDDQCELWLSANESHCDKRLIAKVSRYTGFREWNRYEDQTSKTISLEEGISYYFELLHRQGEGDGHFSVSWKTPGSYREIIESRHLGSYRRDTADGDGDGLPDAWEQEYGLSVVQDAMMDADGDGILNEQEFRVGSDPSRSDAEHQSGLVRYEVWDGVRGEFTCDLTQHQRFPGRATSVSYLERFEAPVDRGDHFGARLRGYVNPPVTGDYRFWISGDNRAELWLGGSADKFDKSRIASVPDAVDLYEWEKYPGQRSDVIRLMEGRLYYIEAVYKEGTDFDHLAVAWQVPGKTRHIIEGENLVAYASGSDDADDDDLRDDDENRIGLFATGDQAATNVHSAYGDLDGDGVDNETELRNGSNPAVAEQVHTDARIPWECWLGIEGYHVNDLVRSRGFPGNPDKTVYLDRLDTRRSLENNYGSRIRGYITPPRTDTYTFVLSGDNSCEFWISDDESPFHRKLAAQIQEWTYLRHWSDYPSQKSRPMVLEAGRSYYFEVLHKEAGGEDYVSVAWESAVLLHQIIGGDYLKKYVPVAGDSDDDGLPDAWETQVGLHDVSAELSEGSFGDPDKDLLPNYIEYQLGTDPQIPDATGRPGIVLWEKWDGISGRTVDSFVSSKKFLGPPSMASYRMELSSLQGNGDDFGARMRGHLVAPKTGTYTFSISGDDGCELWISTDASKFNRRKIAGVRSWSGYQQWGREPGQSAQVELTEGERYFIEVLHKEGIWQDHVSVAWRVPGSKTLEIIQGKHLISYNGDPNDSDDDYLPDDWEKNNNLRTDSNGRYTQAEGRLGDLDGDGLTNVEEWVLGTRADMADTDGDGIDDRLEASVLGTHPGQSDVGNLRLITSVGGTEYRITSGKWDVTANGGVVNGGLSGSLDCSIEVPVENYYLLGVDYGVVQDGGVLAYPSELVVTIDGKFAGRKVVSAATNDVGQLKLLTPWLGRGMHTVGIRMVNSHPERLVAINRISVEAVGGADLDGNGRADWVDVRLAQTRTDSFPNESHVSPAFVEGIGSPETVSATGDLDIVAAPHGRWYANVPLAVGRSTDITFSFAGGHSQSGSLGWTPTDVLRGGETLLRSGDSLLLTAGNQTDNGNFQILMGDNEIHSGKLGDKRPVSFDKSGVYWLRASAVVNGRPVSSVHQIKVLRGGFADNNWFAKGHVSNWLNPMLPDEAFLDFDDNVIWNRRVLDEGTLLSIIVSEVQPTLGVARLYENGPILAQTGLSVLEAFGGSGTGMRYVENLASGGYLVEMPVTLTAVPPDIRVVIEIFVPGVVFDDGTMIKELTAENFDDYGTSLVYFMMAQGVETSVCHRIKVYQGDRLIAHYE